MEFPATSWDQLDAIRAGGQAARQQALNQFAQRYERPIIRFFSALTRNDEKARELAQSFFLKIVLEGNLIARASRDKGQFRYYLMRALRNFATESFRTSRPGAFVRPDDDERGWDAFVAPDQISPESQFYEGWIEALLATALERLQRSCAAKNQNQHYELFRAYYTENPEEPPPWRELATRFGLDEKTARNRADTARHAYGVIAMDLVVEETGSPEAAQAELQFLRSAARLRPAMPRGQTPRNVDREATQIGLFAMAESTEAPSPNDPTGNFERGLAVLLGARRARELLLDLCDPATPVAALRDIKDLAKQLTRTSRGEQADAAAGVAYNAAIAAAFATCGENISSLPIRDRLDLYERLAERYRNEPLGRVFRRAVDRASVPAT